MNDGEGDEGGATPTPAVLRRRPPPRDFPLDFRALPPFLVGVEPTANENAGCGKGGAAPLLGGALSAASLF
jgi:hypothetical protein